MSLSISWELPARATINDPGAWIQIAQAAEYAGLDGLFIPSGTGYPESFTVAAALCAHTSRLRLTTSLSSEVMLPAALAAAAQSLQSISHGRLQLHLPEGPQSIHRLLGGERLNRDQRHQRIDEYLQILGHLLKVDAPPLNFSGRYFQVENACLARPDIPPIPLWLDDSQAPALIAAHAKQCLLRADHPRRLAANLARVRTAAAQQSRQLRFAMRLRLITRQRAERAWEKASSWLLQQTSDIPPTATSAHAAVTHLASAEIRRFELYPNLCHPQRAHAPLLIGSIEQVAARLEEFHALGIDHIVFSAWPSVREVMRLGEEVLPRLKARGIQIGGALAC
jgi:alkanesulfonate monooxygenase